MQDSHSTQSRFTDENKTLAHFGETILVACPACGKQAQIRRDELRNARLSCAACSLVKEFYAERFQLSLNSACPKCGQRITNTWYDQPKPHASILITCPHCGKKQEYPLKSLKYRITRLSARAGEDPYFGATLWLRLPFRDELFWAYNADHLNYLKRYIAALHRQRNERTGMTLVERLPTFIKSAKNRPALLRLISQLEKIL